MSDTFVTPSQSADGWAHITVQPTWYIRFYLWLYHADPDSINTCKLFWAFVFAPFVLLIHAVGVPVLFVAQRVAGLFPKRERRVATIDEMIAYDAARLVKRSKREARIEAISMRLSMLYAKFAPALRIVGIALGVLISLALVGFLVWLTASETAAVLQAFLFIGGCTAAAVAGLALISLVFGAFDKRAAKRNADPNAGPGFFALMKMLAVSFHHHTCAKVTVASAKD